ncbi:superoxide dismutase (Cu-Zn) [Elysia marginata]|uniref:Superoxide dismutase (Cu-Zn) n=1 Tax=Elysia marginata TaxID=1093978 RepID=A0AAV4H692_9GAST|nr:superoxide dismutase (Cu-Zn) [Elysia marginata]
MTSKSTSYNLPLSGVNSIKGRSVAVVDGSTIVSCATIDWDLASWTRIDALATYTGQVTGTISMHQHVHPDGAMSDTTILTDLKYTNPSQSSLNHNWHTHEKLVSGDSQAATGRCMSTGPHYNPFKAAITEAAYATKCSRTNQLRCELGDQSKKTMTIDIGRGRALHTDTLQPLLGKFTGEVIVVIQNSNAEETKVLVHFLGPRSAEIRSRFTEAINNDRISLGAFNPVNSAGFTRIDNLLVLIAVVPSVIFSLMLMS